MRRSEKYRGQCCPRGPGIYTQQRDVYKRQAQYGAGKAYIAKLTEAVAYESRDCVDVMVATLGSTITPSWLKNQPGGEAGEAAIKKAMTPEATIDEIFKQIGKVRSLVVGEVNRQAVHHWHCDISADEAAEYMGKFYE